MIKQYIVKLPEYRRGYHLITSLIENKITAMYQIGTAHIFIQHTSAGITINENVDPSVRIDFESFINKLIPENLSYLTHTLEGADDMPAHLKASIIGQSITIPITKGNFNLGTWQGIYLCEFRDYGGPRTIIVTVSGE